MNTKHKGGSYFGDDESEAQDAFGRGLKDAAFGTRLEQNAAAIEALTSKGATLDQALAQLFGDTK